MVQQVFGVAGTYSAAEEWHYVAEYVCVSFVFRMNWCYSVGLKIQDCCTLETPDAFTHLKQYCLYPQARQWNGFCGYS